MAFAIVARMGSTGQQCTLDVLLLLTRGEEVLLALREGTGFADGQWNLPSGKVDPGEPAQQAIQREAHEELGLSLPTSDLALSSTIHCRNSPADIRLGLTFHLTHNDGTHGRPRNAEPDKCAKIEWHPISMLPSNTMPYSALAVTLFSTGGTFGSLGW